MQGRQVQNNYQNYRYGFNGKENDDGAKGQSNQIDYGATVYDPRVVRFLSLDPLTKSYPFYRPYQYAGNNPIRNKDVDGGEPKDYTYNWVHQSLFDLNLKKEVGYSDGTISVYDSKLGPINVKMVYDMIKLPDKIGLFIRMM